MMSYEITDMKYNFYLGFLDFQVAILYIVSCHYMLVGHINIKTCLFNVPCESYMNTLL